MFSMNYITNALAFEFLGYSVQHYLSAIGLFLGLTIVFLILRGIILRYIGGLAAKTSNELDDTVVDVVRAIPRPFFYYISFYVALGLFTIPQNLTQALFILLVFWAAYHVMKIVQILVSHLGHMYMSKNRNAKGAISLVTFLVQFTLWITALILILSNLGINVTSLITGLGIGGIAVALALQNILGDLFSYLAIHFDQPFSVGDYVVVGDTSGTIKKIGVRTTRIKSLDGEEVVVSNKEITSSQVKNFRRLEKRRISLTLGVTYDTTLSQLKQIPKLVEDVVSKVNNVTFCRCNLRSFGDFSQDLELIYYVEDRAFETYVVAHEQILLGIKEVFDKEGIGFAFPTQVVYKK